MEPCTWDLFPGGSGGGAPGWTIHADDRRGPRSLREAVDALSVTKHPRASRVEGSRPPTRTPQPHPDAGRTTRRMPFEQLRALVVELLEPDDEAVDEFDTQPTTHRPSQPGLPRVSTLDQLIASLPKR